MDCSTRGRKRSIQAPSVPGISQLWREGEELFDRGLKQLDSKEVGLVRWWSEEMCEEAREDPGPEDGVPDWLDLPLRSLDLGDPLGEFLSPWFRVSSRRFV